MAEFSVLSRQCPVCRAKAVRSIEGRRGFGVALYRCEQCKTELTSGFTAATLWALPVGVILFVALLPVLDWLKQSSAVTGYVRAGVVGAIGAFAGSVTLNVALRGIVFRQWKS